MQTKYGNFFYVDAKDDSTSTYLACLKSCDLLRVRRYRVHAIALMALH